MVTSDQQNGYFKKYARDYRVQTTEENFTKGIKFEQTPLELGEHKMVINYDMLNDGVVITPRKGIRVNEVALPLTTPDLYPKITEDMLLTNNLDAIEEDGTHYRLFVANECSEESVGLHTGPAELWVINRDTGETYDILDEYNIDTLDMYAIDMSFEVGSIKDVEAVDHTIDSGETLKRYEFFFSINKQDYNCKFEDATIFIDEAYYGGLCFKTLSHPFALTIGSVTGELVLVKAIRGNTGWIPDPDDTALDLVAEQTYNLKPKTNYYILPKTKGADLPSENPYITKETTVEGATVSFEDSDPTFVSGERTFTYNVGTATAALDGLGITATVNTELYFKKIHEAGTQTYAYLLNTIEETHTMQNFMVSVDRSIYNKMIPTAGTARFIYCVNIKSSITTNVSGASCEVDIHRFNRKKSATGTYTFTYNLTNKSWQIDGADCNLVDYGVLFKDPNGSLANNNTITIVTAAKNMWQLDDNYIVLKDYGITCTPDEGYSLGDGDSINITGVTAGTWLDEDDNYVKAIDYGIDIIDPDFNLQDGDTLTVVTTAPTGWYYDDNLVELSDYNIELKDPTSSLKNDDTIKITKAVIPTTTSIALGRGKMETPGSMYYIPADANGNGFPLSNSRTAKAIGCFAWNNCYYNFNSHGELIRSRYKTAEDGVIATYYTEAMTPRSIKASEAISSGFNMLSDDPYAFSDSFGEGNISLQGIMLYDAADNLIPEPLLNQFYRLRCFYSVARNTRYKVKWSYREINTSDWVDIEEHEYFYNKDTDTVPEALEVSQFSSPIENCVIRVQAFKWDKEPVISYSTSVPNANIIINSDELKKQFTEAGKYAFSYDGFVWKYQGKAVNLASYGITYSDVASELKAGSTFEITLEYKELYPDEPENVITMSIAYAIAPSTATANKELKNYNLSRCTGMLYWKGHIWLYGLAEDPTVLFASDINEPTYFPYPNNIDIFDEPILYCAPFNDNMLIFTRSTLYKLTLSDNGYWTKSIIQADLNFTEFDMNMVRIVKNMVFFKSGDYYYMVVPKTLSLQNELAIAPVSKNIEKFLDSFVDNVTELFETLYDYKGSIELTAHYNFLNYEDVHNVYTFEFEGGLLVNLELLYNTVDRYWRVYTYESQELYKPLRQDATKQCAFYAPLHGKFDKDDVVTDFLGVQILEATETRIKDFYIPRGSKFYKIDGEWKKDESKIETSFDAIHTYKNWTLLDCGYRNIITDYKKRCRELQFKFNNVGKSTVTFLTEFILDGETRKSYYKYNTEHIVDPTNEKFGYIYVERVPVENLDMPGGTLGGADENDINAWSIDYSRFPEIAFWKARFKVSGKGYTPRFKLISRTEENYELIGYSWVYRAMYSR